MICIEYCAAQWYKCGLLQAVIKATTTYYFPFSFCSSSSSKKEEKKAVRVRRGMYMARVRTMCKSETVMS